MKNASFRYQILNRIVRSGIAAFLLSVILSVIVFYPVLRQESIQNNKMTNELILQKLEETLGFVESYAQYLSSAIGQSGDIAGYFLHPNQQEKAIAEMALNNFNSYSTMVRGVALLSDAADPLDSINNLSESDYQLLESDFIMEMRKKETFSSGFSQVYEVKINRNKYATTAYARNFFMANRWYTLVLFVNLNNMEKEIGVMAKGKLDVYYLQDSTGHMFFSQGSKEELNRARDLNGDMNGNYCANRNRALVFGSQSVTTNYRVVSMVPLSQLLLELCPYLIGIFAAMLLCMLLILWMTSRSVSDAVRPIKNLSEHMLKAAAGDLDSKVKTTRTDEIGQLESSYNKMIDDLSESMHVIREKEELEQQQRFSLLVSQIDPHFIYNTINSINYLARRKRCEDIITVNTALLAILRDRLRVNDIQITDTVAHEIDTVGQYIEIERFMYGGALEVKWDVSDNLLEEQIPKNMIQPIVENALFHGLIDEESGELNGMVRISLCRTQDGCLQLCVEDNGEGMDHDRLEQVRKEKYDPSDRGHRIGLSNIRGRLYYLYGSEDMLKIESEQGKGTKVTVIFRRKPFTRKRTFEKKL